MEAAVWDAFVFTQQTVNGKHIWSNRGVEWLANERHQVVASETFQT